MISKKILATISLVTAMSWTLVTPVLAANSDIYLLSNTSTPAYTKADTVHVATQRIIGLNSQNYGYEYNGNIYKFDDVSILFNSDGKNYTQTMSDLPTKVTAVAVVSSSQIVTFKDGNLQNAIRNAINKPTGTLYKSDVQNIKTLFVGGIGITDISGIENLTNLKSLDLHSNQISDISKLTGLTNLASLVLGGNVISDISALKGLTNLTSLNLDNNEISDISSLKGLTNLTSVDLGTNYISDLSSLTGLTNLTSINLGSNHISNLSSLTGLTNLMSMDLSSNYISDLSSLTGLINLTSINLGTNHISDISPLTGLTNLTSLGLISNQISSTNQQILKKSLSNCSITF